VKRCPKCGELGTDDDVFCEVDGVRLEGGALVPAAPPPLSTPEGVGAAVRCGACGLTDADSGDGYCSSCGHRLAAATAGEPVSSAFTELAAPTGTSRHLAELSDRGLRHPHNEDSTAVAAGELRGEAWAVLVVCDGVSTSTGADRASQIAATTTRDALAHFVRSGDAAFEGAPSAMGIAIRAAHVALCATPIDRAPVPAGEEKLPSPGTTIVAALVFRRRVVVGWVGDSRAYWVAKGGAELLTRDHSWVNEVVAKGEMTEAEAMGAPLAHALTRCLGPLEVGEETIEEVVPEVRVRDLPGAGDLVLCTDGLWNYLPGAGDVASVVHAAGEGASAGAIAARLVNHALRKGGADNVSVVVYQHR
jgi:serine/threonine protein phosphatase PrpC